MNFRVTDEQIFDEIEKPITNLTDLSLPFNVKIKCTKNSNKFKVTFNDYDEAELNYDPLLLVDTEQIHLLGSIGILSAGFTGEEVTNQKNNMLNFRLKCLNDYLSF